MLSAAEKDFLRLDESLLPFRIIEAKTEFDLERVARIRSVSYGRHLPALAETMKTPDANDYNPSYRSLLALSKLDGSCLGTVRIQIADAEHNENLQFEQSFSIPSALKQGKAAEIARLAIPQDKSSLSVRIMLIKAAYWYCRFSQVNHVFLCARRPLDRFYKGFDLRDLTPNGEFVNMAHIGDVPHRIFWFHTLDIEAHWKAISNPMYPLYFRTLHPDLLDNVQLRALMNEQFQRQQRCA
ncbi:hypothetical protein [Limnobacter sp.]|uniref:N-acyl amino acid synthase FeeM domain-containing protein n=1 Tax=Limnobacter sp. TaxID=2003368 RepID=UPI00258EC65E|nr:hypothetical protein [Limnobacter sp.]